MQLSLSTISACRSLPPSIWTLLGIGYGPASLSLAYWNETLTFCCVPGTTVIGIPIGEPFQRPEPKSGCSPVDAPIELTICAEFDATGSVSTLRFHQLSVGKTGQFGAPATGEACAEDAPSESASATPISPAIRLTLRLSASGRTGSLPLTSVARATTPCTPASPPGSAPASRPNRCRRASGGSE